VLLQVDAPGSDWLRLRAVERRQAGCGDQRRDCGFVSFS
jgi:hypothetical protein